MTNSEKNKWLVENVLRECWHDKDAVCGGVFKCSKCGELGSRNLDFYTSDPDQQAINFFKLWRAIKEKEWLEQFMEDLYIVEGIHWEGDIFVMPFGLISCSVLADAIGQHFNWGEVK